MARFHDFDAAFAEDQSEAEPLRVRLFGEMWDLPATLPAAVPLKVERWKAEGRKDDDLTEGEVMLLAADVVPRVVLDAWLDRGLTTERLGEVIVWVIQQYDDDDDEDAAGDEEETPEGEAPAPTVGAPEPSASSSNDGDSSKPTSNANTASVSHVG